MEGVLASSGGTDRLMGVLGVFEKPVGPFFVRPHYNGQVRESATWEAWGMVVVVGGDDDGGNGVGG